MQLFQIISNKLKLFENIWNLGSHAALRLGNPAVAATGDFAARATEAGCLLAQPEHISGRVARGNGSVVGCSSGLAATAVDVAVGLDELLFFGRVSLGSFQVFGRRWLDGALQRLTRIGRQRWVIAIKRKAQLKNALPIISILSNWHYQLK